MCLGLGGEIAQGSDKEKAQVKPHKNNWVGENFSRGKCEDSPVNSTILRKAKSGPVDLPAGATPGVGFMSPPTPLPAASVDGSADGQPFMDSRGLLAIPPLCGAHDQCLNLSPQSVSTAHVIAGTTPSHMDCTSLDCTTAFPFHPHSISYHSSNLDPSGLVVPSVDTFTGLHPGSPVDSALSDLQADFGVPSVTGIRDFDGPSPIAIAD